METFEADLTIIHKYHGDFFGGWKPSDAELLLRYQYAGVREEHPGELLDWLGIRTDLTFHAWVPVPESGVIHILGVPIPDDRIHAEAIEYIALIVALERAQANGLTKFTAVELGASYGPWITAAGVLARRAGFEAIDLTGVEASENTVPKIIEHAARNRLTRRLDTNVNAIHAAVHIADEPVYFPRADVSSDNGAQVSTQAETVDYRGVAMEYDRVEGVSLGTLLKDADRVDFLHLDLQGAEENLLQNPDFLTALDTKVATMFLATQSRLIEGVALKALSNLGWRLIRERPTTYAPNDRTADINGWTTRDGGQLWLNRRFGEMHVGT